MMRFIDLRIGIEPGIVHDAVNQVINDGSNSIDTPSRSYSDWGAAVSSLWG
jgi:hypothetical protein